MKQTSWTMGYRRRALNLRPVHSIKHVVDKQNALTAGSAGNEFLVSAVDDPVLANTAEVETGSTVNSIYLNVTCNPTTEAALPNVYIIIFKNPGGSLANIVPNAVGASDNKRFVIHQEMRMLGGSITEIPVTIFRGVIKIPKGYRRFGINDLLTVRLLAPGVAIEYCVQAIYKEYR